LKNFSLLESEIGDYLLSPAYDLINTRMHVADTDFALDKGLFADDFESEAFKKKRHRSKDDFIEFAKRIGVDPDRVDVLLEPFLTKQEKVEILINRSFLSPPNKRGYLMEYSAKLNSLKG
jgi:serine/threonine-protein kinase HipA